MLTVVPLKPGENIAQILLSRKGSISTPPEVKEKVGLWVKVKAHPSVEEFMQESATQGPVDCDVHARGWASRNGKPLMVYSVPHLSGQVQNGIYRLDKPGQAISRIEDSGYTNISFLRLVGVGSEEGVTFGLYGVEIGGNLDQLKSIQTQLGTAIDQFYSDYLRAVDLMVEVSTREVGF